MFKKYEWYSEKLKAKSKRLDKIGFVLYLVSVLLFCLWHTFYLSLLLIVIGAAALIASYIVKREDQIHKTYNKQKLKNY